MHLFCRAQNVFDTEIPPDMEGSNSSLSSDSIPESNVPHFRHTWQWERNGVYKREIALDTLMDGIQNFNTIFKKNISNTYLGNFPSPYLSNIFITRETVAMETLAFFATSLIVVNAITLLSFQIHCK